MPEPTNAERAAWARLAVEAFTQVCDSEEKDIICDLICDLMHLAREMGQDPEAEVRRAEMHFSFEAAPEEEDA